VKYIYLNYFTGIILVAVLAIMVIVLAITDDGLHDNIVSSDLAIVPGNTVEADGRPSKRLQGRLDRALVMYEQRYCKAILVSGAIGAEGFDEADVMRRYLVGRGVPGHVIFTDSQGTNTYETARYAAGLIRSHGFKSAMLVSQFFHISRFRLAMKKHGVDAVGNAHAQYFELRDGYSLLREVPGYIIYAFKAQEI
jgi:vancomycin permeability regulator SanA